jgi:predicted transposase/invertase (TIGR01784 family)
MPKKGEIAEYMLPTNDFIFKRIFGSESNEELTKDLISSIIGCKIKSIEFKNPYLLRDFKDDKEEILDLRAVLDNDIQCDIEVQVTNYHDIDKRILDYWAKLYHQSLKKGERNYARMKKTIIILIATFDVDNLKGIENYYTRWRNFRKKFKNFIDRRLRFSYTRARESKKVTKRRTFRSKRSFRRLDKIFYNPI